MTTEVQRAEGRQTAAEGASEPGPCGPPCFLASSAAFLWTSSSLQFSFPRDASIWLRLPAPFSLPLPTPSLKGQVPPSLLRACPFMALLFQNVAKFINSPFPETRNNLRRVQCGGESWELRPGPGLQPGPKPKELWRGTGPSLSLGLSFSNLQSKGTGLIIPEVLLTFRHTQFTTYKYQFCKSVGPIIVKGLEDGLQL